MASYFKTKISCYIGLVVQALVNNFLPILFIVFQTKYNLSYEQLGRIVFINFFTQIFADALTPKITKILGYRKTALLCQGCAALGLSLLSILPLLFDDFFIGLILPVFIFSFSSGIIEVLLSPMIELLPTKRKAANMSFLHSFYCWGQALTVIGTTLLLMMFGFDKWNYIPLIWAIIPFINMFNFINTPIIEPADDEKTDENKSIFKSRQFFCFAVIMFCAGASEITLSEWSSVFAQNALGVDKFIGDLFGPCAFALFMGFGRILFGLFSTKLSIRKVLIVNNVLCALCYLTVGLCDIPFLSLIACALCGFSVSISWPGTYSLASAHFGKTSTIIFSIFALCGDFGCSTGPWLLGFVADAVSFKSGFVFSALFPIVMIFVALFLLKEKDCVTQ